MRQKSANAKSREEKQRIEEEIQKKESEKKMKELEKQQAEEARRRREEEAKRIAEENAKKNENQKQQEANLSKLQSANNAKLKEIQRLQSADTIDGVVASANALLNTINTIEQTYTTSMNNAIAETRAFYQKKRAEIVKTKYESQSDFESRKAAEESKLNNEENYEVSEITRKYNSEKDNYVAELKQRLKETEGKMITKTGSEVSVVLGKLNLEQEYYPLTVSDSKNPAVKEVYKISVMSSSPDERRQKCKAVDEKAKSGMFTGEILYSVMYDKTKKQYAAEWMSIRAIDKSNQEEIGYVESETYIAMLEVQRQEKIRAEEERIRAEQEKIIAEKIEEREAEIEKIQKRWRASSSLDLVDKIKKARNACIAIGVVSLGVDPFLLLAGTICFCISIPYRPEGSDVRVLRPDYMNFITAGAVCFSVMGGTAIIGSLLLVLVRHLHRAKKNIEKLSLYSNEKEILFGYNWEKHSASIGVRIRI